MQQVTKEIVARILTMRDESARRAALANWRQGVGKAPGEQPKVTGLLLQGIPEEMYADSIITGMRRRPVPPNGPFIQR